MSKLIVNSDNEIWFASEAVEDEGLLVAAGLDEGLSESSWMNMVMVVMSLVAMSHDSLKAIWRNWCWSVMGSKRSNTYLRKFT